MIKIDMARIIAEKMKTTLREAETFLDVFMETVTEGLKKGEKVQLAGFGTWEVRKYSGREGRNPKTGEKLQIESFDYPAFKSGKKLKESISGEKRPVIPILPEKNGKIGKSGEKK